MDHKGLTPHDHAWLHRAFVDGLKWGGPPACYFQNPPVTPPHAMPMADAQTYPAGDSMSTGFEADVK